MRLPSLTWTAARRLLGIMAPREPQPRPLPKPPPEEIIPPDPPPDPPDTAPPPSGKPKRGRRLSTPDLGDKRHVPRTPDPPIVISRLSREAVAHDSRSTPSVGSGAYRGFDLLHIR